MKYIAEVSFKIEVEAEDHIEAQKIVSHLVRNTEWKGYPDIVIEDFDIISIREEKE